MEVYGRVYLITNKINDKKYVGVTTKTLEERFQAHLDKATNERSVIQKAMKKYGKKNFEISLLEEAFSKKELFELEIKWIAEFNSYLGWGYNQTEGGGGIVNMSENIRKKISKTKTGKKIPKLQGRERKIKEKMKISRSLGAKFVKGIHKENGNVIYLNYATEGKKYGLNPSLICAVIKGKRNHHKGYVFEYVDYVNPDLIAENNKSAAVQRIESETQKGI